MYIYVNTAIDKEFLIISCHLYKAYYCINHDHLVFADEKCR